jgi:hypothetical protein
MKVKFVGFQGNRQNYRDFAIEIITETEFEKSFFDELFNSDFGSKQMQPKGALLFGKDTGLSILVEAEDFKDSQLAKERKQRLDESNSTTNS